MPKYLICSFLHVNQFWFHDAKTNYDYVEGTESSNDREETLTFLTLLGSSSAFAQSRRHR